MASAEPTARTGPRTTTRRAWIDLAKGVAIVMVVAYHAQLFLEAEGVAEPLGRARAALELYPMPAFFLLAGLLQRRLRTSPWALVWRRRVLPFLYLYVVWSLVRFAFFSALPGVRTDGPPDSGRDWTLLLLAPLVPTSVYWFLWATAVVTAVTWLFRRRPRAYLVGTGVVSGLVASGLVSTGAESIDRTLEYAFAFAVGVHAGPLVQRLVERATPRRAVAWAALAVVVMVALAALPLLRRVPGAVLAGQLVVVLAVLRLAAVVGPRPGTRWLAALGRQSLPLYLLHLYPVALLTIAVRQVDALRAVPPRGLPVVLLVAAAALAVALPVARVVPAGWRLFQPPLALVRTRAAVADPLAPDVAGPLPAAPAGSTPPDRLASPVVAATTVSAATAVPGTSDPPDASADPAPVAPPDAAGRVSTRPASGPLREMP
ncbi:acyltransferase family protein [Cellulomonas telluris]|uniref:acyltransferase family protein n=1 Tax=Cellulomonas telluris TaxID=2306636 RepID=UPI0010A75DAB|nr:acyltransferase [Cellulomonas telluris]